ncbi:hypothetical protein PSU4_47010 [Pseudonocardia sulfidoxydans NBRC 16205]|uniref:Uncharacterized protein n=1 Tax=Pseudonocardia sulfidoxydans NBRC 16205 TaxID=1223511 RepID=A0A511DN09_9PSEU|nr:hypothetical protein PSU4_47010 [Pseudonocardia sulfidoxydans NBRC 16205]
MASIELPHSGTTFRETSDHSFEILTKTGSATAVETHGLTLVEGGNTASTRKESVSYIYGQIVNGDSPALPQIRVHAGKSAGLSLMVAQVGRRHWVAEITGRFERVTVQDSSGNEWDRGFPL